MRSFRRIDMPWLWRAVGRPVLAYFAAACAAGVVMFVVGVSTTTFGERAHDVARSVRIIPYFAAFIAVLAVVPTIIAAAVLRMTRLRRCLAETMAGAVIGLAVSSAFLLAIGGDAILTWSFLAPLSAYGTAGAVAGLTYWLALGRPRNPKAQ